MTDAHTQAVHAGRRPLPEQPVPHVPLIDLSSTYPLQDLDGAARSLGALAGGAATAHESVYSRLHNPTVAGFENALAALEGAAEGVGFASGMAALTACLLALRLRGAAHVIAVRPLYGGSDHLLASGLTGLDVSWARPDPGAIARAVRPDTGLVILETPANPTLALLDIEAVVEAVAAVPVLVDSTFATPVLQTPLALGARLALHSATKFLGGHGDTVGGVIACDGDWAAALRQVRIATGGILHPLSAYLLHRGLQTLPLRVERAQATARELARRLAAHPAVERLRYPELDPAWSRIGGRQMRGPGTLLALELRGGRPAALAAMEAMRLVTRAVSLGSVDTLVQHPASLTHQVAGARARSEGGVTEGLLRLSVGLEDPEDLWADLDQALRQPRTAVA